MTRREMKRRGRRSLRQHYLIFTAACLIAAFLAAEFRWSLQLTELRTYETAQVQDDAGGAWQTAPAPSGTGVGLQEVWQDILRGDAQSGGDLAQRLQQEAIERAQEGNPAFGRSRGVLANLINQVSSGSILVTLAAAAGSLAGSENAGILLLVSASALLFFLFWFFVQNTYKVIMRRIFLEGRCYKTVPFQRFVFLLRVKKWVRASWIIFVTGVYQMLWSLTVVGAFVKHYSYFLVPYITAENPAMTARQAVTLSRRMMNGHKWECFVFELSFFGWYLLSAATLGLSDLFYANAYRTAAFAEYYAGLREKARAQGLPGAELLNDVYLYEHPAQETIEARYGDVIAVMEKPAERLERLRGWKGFLARNFGVLVFRTKYEKQYERAQADRIRLEELFGDVTGEEYPARLYPIPEEERRALVESIHYVRHYSVWSLTAMFFTFSLIGWLWEVGLFLITDGVFVNRGSMHGPWLPIYGSGGVLILTVLNRLRKKPLAEFAAILVLCGFVEYMTSYVMELATGMRWWDYSGYFLNLNGRICAEGLLVFGVGGMAIVYVLAPVLDNLLMKVDERKLKAVCVVLLAVFCADAVYSRISPNQGEGITDDGMAAATPPASVESVEPGPVP